MEQFYVGRDAVSTIFMTSRFSELTYIGTVVSGVFF
jgi:hypothetical protein